MDPFDPNAWKAQEPPAGFAERVVAKALAERTASRRRRRVIGATASALALAAAAAFAAITPKAPPRGEAVAATRTSVDLGGRAVAVLEPAASVAWAGDDVTQRAGDVFYRVEPGKPFRVHTPAGDIGVLGTCFRVMVRATEIEGDMGKRDAMALAAGAVVGAVVVVGVYEGKVRASQGDKGAVELAAGQAARLDARGVRRAGDTAAMASALAAAPDETAVAAENRSLAGTVRELSQQIAAIDGQRKDLEGKIAAAEKELAAAGKGGDGRGLRHPYDLDERDWAELSRSGSIKYRIPCNGWKPSPDRLTQLGLAPDDAEMLERNYQRSNERVWSVLRPLCAQAIGNAEVADKLGPSTCTSLVLDLASKDNPAAADEARRQVGEIRAGKRPPPGPNDTAHPVLRLFLALTGEAKLFEADLAQDVGPEEAHRLLFADGMCTSTSSYGGAPRPDPK